MATRDSTNSDRAVNSQTEPPAFPRGINIPEDVLRMVQSGGVWKKGSDEPVVPFTNTHAMFLGYVDRMVNWSGAGCWASNDFLSRLLGVTRRRIQQLIADCEQLGYLTSEYGVEIEHKGQTLVRRVLETKWSRPNGGVKPISSPPMKYISSNGKYFVLTREDNTVADAGRRATGGVQERNGTSTQPPAPHRRRRAKPPEPEQSPRLPNGGSRAPALEEGKASHPHLNIIELDTKLGLKQSPLGDDLAARLRAAVVAAELHQRQWSHKQWSAWMTSALMMHGEARVRQVLDWHCKHLKDKMTPQAWSGRTFYEKFLKIEKQMERQQERSPDIAVTEPAKKIADRLAAIYQWPGNLKAELPKAVQLGLDNVGRFVAELKRIRGPLDDKRIRPATDTKLTRAAHHALGNVSNAVNYVSNYFEDLGAWVGTSKVTTLFPKFVPGLDNPKFAELCRKDVTDSEWALLMKEIGRAD